MDESDPPVNSPVRNLSAIPTALQLTPAVNSAPVLSQSPKQHVEEPPQETLTMDVQAAAEADQQAEVEPEEEAAPPAAPVRFTIAPSELTHLVRWVLQNELKVTAGLTSERAAQAADNISNELASVLAQYQAAGVHLLGDEVPAVTVTSLPTLAVLPIQVNKLKSALQEQKAR